MSTTPSPETKAAPAAPPPPPPDTVQIKVDGRSIAVPKTMPDWQGKPQATTMLQACQAAGVDVPHYCYHSKLPVAGNCRMCLVEFGTPVIDPATKKPVVNEDGSPKIARSVLPYEPGTPRGAIACATPISPGMEIYPGSAATKQMREAVLESLLINHPLDCPICDQAGECKLQEYSVQHGQATSRFVEPKVHKPKAVDLGPRIMLDDERCVLCTRCIRFTKDIAGDDALGIVNRGSFNTIAAYPGRAFDNNYTLNTVDLCPVGALTSKDFRFKMRVWFLKETKSVCTSCGTGCNITVGSRENTVHRFEPRENDGVNGPWMCDSGRLNYKWIGAPDRLRDVRLNGTASSWGEIVATLAARLKNAPAGSVAIVAGATLANEDLYLAKRLAARIGAVTDSWEKTGEPDKLLVAADKNPNTNGARLLGVSFTEAGIQLPAIEDAVKSGKIQTLILLGDDGGAIDPAVVAKAAFSVVSAVLPTPATASATAVLPSAAFAEKRGTFVNVKGRLQKFWKAVDAPGDARPESEFLADLLAALGEPPRWNTIEGLFNQLAAATPAFSGVTWASLGDAGANVPI
jgi:NADH-quinone oxidoreductase subunit G